MILPTGIHIKTITVDSADWDELPSPPDVSDKSNILPKTIKVEGLGIYVEDLNLTLPRGTDLLLRFTSSPLEGEEGAEEAGKQPPEAPEKREEEVTAVGEKGGAEPNWFQRWFCGKKEVQPDENKVEEENWEEGSKYRRGRRGWHMDTAEPVDEQKIYPFDGRVSWRRLLAPFCRRKLYDLELEQWIDDPHDMDEGLKAEARTGFLCSGGEPKIDHEEMINFYERTDINGYVIGASEEMEEEGMIHILGEGGDHILGEEEFEEPVRTTTAPDGSNPSLRLKLSQMDNFLNVAAQLCDVYHTYVLEPRSLECVLTLAALPVVPNTAPQRCWSRWGEERRPTGVRDRSNQRN